MNIFFIDTKIKMDLDKLIVNFYENSQFFDLTLEECVEFNKTTKKIQKILSDEYIHRIRDANSFKLLTKYVTRLSNLSGIDI